MPDLSAFEAKAANFFNFSRMWPEDEANGWQKVMAHSEVDPGELKDVLDLIEKQSETPEQRDARAIKRAVDDAVAAALSARSVPDSTEDSTRDSYEDITPDSTEGLVSVGDYSVPGTAQPFEQSPPDFPTIPPRMDTEPSQSAASPLTVQTSPNDFNTLPDVPELTIPPIGNDSDVMGMLAAILDAVDTLSAKLDGRGQLVTQAPAEPVKANRKAAWTPERKAAMSKFQTERQAKIKAANAAAPH